MKKFLFLLSSLLIAAWGVNGQVRNEIAIPDIDGYQTLKCDFHTHSIFSDGTVWPTVRVDEAYREGLDAVAITEHLEYRPFLKDLANKSHNRAYEIAKGRGKSRGIIVIKGSEITRAMPPGHSNAIFLSDADSLDTEQYIDAFKAAKRQDAFIFWNHPGWDVQQPDTTLWWPEHTELYNGGYMQGIEVVNGKYFPEAHRWALEKGLTMLGNSDAHQPMQSSVDFAKGAHRGMTLVFAKERSEEGIKEALLNRRTAVYYGNNLIGEEVYLKQIFEKAVEVKKIKKSEKSVVVTIYNNSDLPFNLKKTTHDVNLRYFRLYTIKPHCTHTITIHLDNGVKGGSVNFEVTNLWVAPGEGMDYSFDI